MLSYLLKDINIQVSWIYKFKNRNSSNKIVASSLNAHDKIHFTVDILDTKHFEILGNLLLNLIM